MEVCTGFELIVIETATALGHDVLEISKRGEAQMIRHMRHGRRPDFRRLSLPSTPTVGNPLRPLQPETV